MSYDADYSDLLHPQTPLKTPPHPPPPCWSDGPGQSSDFFFFFFMIYSVFCSVWKPSLCLTTGWIIDWPNSRQMFVQTGWVLVQKMRVGGGAITSLLCCGGIFCYPVLSKGRQLWLFKWADWWVFFVFGGREKSIESSFVLVQTTSAGIDILLQSCHKSEFNICV